MGVWLSVMRAQSTFQTGLGAANIALSNALQIVVYQYLCRYLLLQACTIVLVLRGCKVYVQVCEKVALLAAMRRLLYACLAWESRTKCCERIDVGINNETTAITQTGPCRPQKTMSDAPLI